MGGSGVSDEPEERLTCSQLFHKLFPEYLAMGMTYEQFWLQDCSLVIAYREAYKIRQEEMNRAAWLNGLYLFKAMQAVPITVNGFAPKGTKLKPYPNKPIDFTPPKKKTAQEIYAEEVQRASDRIKNGMMQFMIGFNAERRKRELLEAERNAEQIKQQEGVTKNV